ncbi:MAG: hypothetical protein ACLRSY_05860 [Acutalibacter sp.]
MLGFRNKDAVILEEDFQAAGAKTFIATDDGSYGHHGLVTDLCQEGAGLRLRRPAARPPCSKR